MTTCLAIATLLVIYHLVLENLVVPAVRMKLRFKLFALRDKVREFEFGNVSEPTKSVAQDVESILNNAIRILHNITISNIIAASREMENNPVLLKKAEKRACAIEEVPELQKIYDQTRDIVARGFVINSAGWFILLVPVLFLIMNFFALKAVLEKLLALKSYEIEALRDDAVCAPA